MINPPPQNSYFYSSSVDTSPKIEHVAIQEPDMKSIPQFQRLSIHQRLDMIERSMMNASFLFDQMDQQRQATGLPALPRVFIAPENFFAKPIPVGSLNATHTRFGASRNYSVGPAEEKQLDVEEKRGVVSGLLAVSQRYPEILMFPGTISFKKPIERNENAQQYAQRHGALEGSHRYNQLVEKFNQKDSRFNKAEAIANYYTQLQYDVIGVQAAFSESRKHVNGNTTHIAHTAGYGMIDGQIVGKYKKVMGFNEVSRQKSGESCAFLPGKLEQPALIHRGVKHSLEICNDHLIAIMSRPENIGNIGDVHIIQSDVANENFTDELMARAKGIVHSSTFEIDPKNGQELAGVTNPSGQKINPVFRNPFVRAYTV